MAFLHLADAATHVGPPWLSILAALAGLGIGALVAFGPRAHSSRKSKPHDLGEGVESPGRDENT